MATDEERFDLGTYPYDEDDAPVCADEEDALIEDDNEEENDPR